MVVNARESDFIETPGGNSGAGLATPRRGATAVSVIRQRQLPGGHNPDHTHDREEVMLLLAGSVAVNLADTCHRLEEGDTLIVPAGSIHRIENDGESTAEWLLIAPAGIRYFHANGDEASPPWSH